MEKTFSNVDIPKLSKIPKLPNQVKLCTENVTEKVSQSFLKSMQSGKFPGNHELIKKNYEILWTELQEIFVYSVSEAK